MSCGIADAVRPDYMRQGIMEQDVVLFRPVIYWHYDSGFKS